MPIDLAWGAAGGLCAAGGIFSWAAVAPSSQVFGPTVRRLRDQSAVALTFDDGPNTAITPRLLDLLVMLSAMARDWKPQTPARVIKHLCRVRGGDIVLLHDGDNRVASGDRRHRLEALEYWLPRWKEAGLRCAPLDETQEAMDELSDGRKKVLRREGRNEADDVGVRPLPPGKRVSGAVYRAHEEGASASRRERGGSREVR
jgi:peptidoglycan/xylan/chitin deacetylase (PgdA/CDA1 family)